MEEHEDTHFCFQDWNSSCRKTSISTSAYITLYIFFSLISAIIVFLNLLVIISISHFKHLHTATNLLILSLAVSDLLVGLIVIPAITVAIMEPCWILGEYFCALLFFINILCSSSSLGNLVLISIDRYVAVCDPLMYSSKITTTRIMCCIFITWCFCIINDAVSVKTYVNVQVPSRCFEECFFAEGDFLVTILDLVITLVVPFLIILTLYLKIFVVARSQAKKVFSKGAATVSGVKTVQANKSERKAAKTLGIIVFNYLICWNPLIYIFSICFSSSKLAAYIITFLPHVNSLINPIIYAFFYPWFKLTAKHVLTLNVMH
ncbi:trace amine-associated receptor 13c-like [Esox lucius]|uniref:trace amine-associated receptor 13c-like n=1 Tax=Esox lucius TaxID=8010 RepID=UPI001477198B|nr:trace amine-associated receptor 13c-like [Esox lucius]